MEDSILKTTKKILGIDAAYTAFDLDIITHINMVFTTLHDLGVGPPEGFFIESDEANWVDFELDPLQRNAVKTYVFLRVKLAFDPPQTSFHILSLEKQVQELEWRLNVRRENVAWVPPSSPSLP
ncbi:MAG TPA: hypothetical protein PKD16_02020 [Saprospiraceae bacterium]|jgi:hypothetical protein|nr:hypothetical protein [Saprospiraceae bacterium]